MKTLKEEVIELLMKRIGVAENEEFEAQFAHEECQVNKFCNGELLTKVNEEWRDDSKWAVFVKYFDVYEFKVIPFKPKIGDKYWWVEVDGKVCSDISERGCTFDCIATAIAFCDYMSNRSPYKEAETIRNQKTFHSLLKILVVVTILNIMIPARDTFYKMTVTNYITPANIDKASDIVDKITDKIIERINKRDK